MDLRPQIPAAERSSRPARKSADLRSPAQAKISLQSKTCRTAQYAPNGISRKQLARQEEYSFTRRQGMTGTRIDIRFCTSSMGWVKTKQGGAIRDTKISSWIT